MRPVMLIRADAGPAIGVGHVMRCLALAQAWRDRGGEAHLVAVDLPQRLARRLQAEQLSHHPIDDHRDAASVADLAEQLGASWLVIDGYEFDAEFQRNVQGRGFMVAVIDDLAQLDGWNTDLLLDQNLGADQKLYPGLSPATRCLFGPGYSLLRREVTEAIRGGREVVAESVRLVVVLFGGSDPQSLTPVALEAVARAALEGVAVTAFVGPACPDLEGIRARAERLEIDVEIAVDPPDYASRLAEADLAVSAAGSTCWELAALGVPAIVTATAENQITVARGLVEAGVAIDAGPPAAWSAADLSRAIRELADDVVTRRSMAAAGRGVVDGEGADRVVSVLQEMNVCAAEGAEAGR